MNGPTFSTPDATRPLAIYLRLLRYVRPYRAAFAAGMFGGIIYSLSMLSFSGLAKYFGDHTFVMRDPRTIVYLPLAVVVIFILRGSGDFTQTYFTGYVARRIVTNLRQQVFEHTGPQPRVEVVHVGLDDHMSPAIGVLTLFRRRAKHRAQQVRTIRQRGRPRAPPHALRGHRRPP